APATAPAQQPGTLTLQPGSDVKGSDGAVLGKLEGTRNNAGAQELTVRGTDGQLKGVPLAGLKPEGTGVTVGWTLAEFTAAPAIPGAPDAASSSAPASTPAAEQPASDAASPDAAPPASESSTTEAKPAEEPATEPTPTETPAPEEPATPPAQPQA
ncbi:MAG: hypothetical protein EBR82_15990, partial [Caulobacteraceae bacterium]|nr:hypothetical protein [Caulobacteraceae bacterium]